MRNLMFTYHSYFATPVSGGCIADYKAWSIHTQITLRHPIDYEKYLQKLWIKKVKSMIVLWASPGNSKNYHYWNCLNRSAEGL